MEPICCEKVQQMTQTQIHLKILKVGNAFENHVLTCSNGPISSIFWLSSEGIEIFLTGRTNLAGDVNKYKPGYAPPRLNGTYPTSRSFAICHIYSMHMLAIDPRNIWEEKARKIYHEQTIELAETFNLRKWPTTFSTIEEGKEPTTRPSKRTERTSGGPAWTSFGSEGVIPTAIKTLRIVFLIFLKSLIFPWESKKDVIPEKYKIV